MFRAIYRASWGVSVGLAVGALSCATERDPINQVQVGALPKSFFVGALADTTDDPEFYMRTTVVRADSGGQDGLFTNSDGQPVVRVKWEITEELLVARLSYERINDMAHNGLRRTEDGQIVAAFPITSHFDVRREYNPSTGEELNVIGENSSDRPYYEREQFRVDWSKNLVTDAFELDTLSQIGIYYGVEWESLSYYVNEPGHPHQPVFDIDGGYFDVTLKAFATPKTTFDDWGKLPACWLYGYWPVTNCNPNEVTLRQAFRRVETPVYEALPYNGTQMELFGLFTLDRLGYDRAYGVVDDKWHRFAARWRLAENDFHESATCASPETTPIGANVHRDEDADGTEDECASVGRGSRCDEFQGRCTLPVRDRQIRTIAWHINDDAPADLFDSAKAALESWNESVREAVIVGRVNECRRTGESDCNAAHGLPEDWRGQYVPPVGEGPAEVPNVFVLCHNPVVADDDKACGGEGTHVRLGDLRYNMINLLPDPEDASPWGIMMDAEDPLTGEKFSGNVNVWTAVTDRQASALADLVMLLNGVIEPDDYIKGENVSSWVAANQPGAVGARHAGLSKEELASRKGAVDFNALGIPHVNSTKKGVPRIAQRQARAKALEAHGGGGRLDEAFKERASRLSQSPLAAKIASPQSLEPNSAPEASRSPFGWMNPERRRAFARKARSHSARAHSCRLDGAEPDHLVGLARTLADRFPAPAEGADAATVQTYRASIYNWARDVYTQGVMAHELGHAMGLRHNFAASFDALNYPTGYWQLRTSNGSIQDICEPGEATGRDCVGPRYNDPITPDEFGGNIGRYATTSVMDYPGDENHDMLLVGPYDRAGVRFAYAGTVDVWNDPGVTVDGDDSETAYRLSAFAVNPGLFGVYYFRSTPDSEVEDEFHHYSEYAKLFNLVQDCESSSDAGAIQGQLCKGPRMDVADYRDLSGVPQYDIYPDFDSPKAQDKQGRIRRGYLFASDEYSDSGNVPAFSYDAGADAYEQVLFLKSNFENRYILDNFRRGRVRFDTWSVTSRVQSHYLDAIQAISKTFAFAALLDGNPTEPSEAFTQDGYFGPLQVAGTMGFDMFAQMLTQPEPGTYCPMETCLFAPNPAGVSGTVYGADAAASSGIIYDEYEFTVPLGRGRYIHDDFDYTEGYFWGDYQSQVGSFNDKIFALYYLSEAFDYFIANSKDDYVDGRYKNVNFATVFPDQTRRLYGAILTGDLDTFSPWVTGEEGPLGLPAPTLQYPQWHAQDISAARPAEAKLVDPLVGWNTQAYAMAWGSVFFPTNWTQNWVHDARITLSGEDAIAWTPAETIAYRDPVSGAVYKAHRAGTETVLGNTRERSVGARIVAWAQTLAALGYQVETDVGGAPVLDAEGAPTFVRDGNGLPVELDGGETARTALRSYVSNLDMFRELTNEMASSFGSNGLP